MRIVDLLGIISVASKSKASKAKNEIISLAIRFLIVNAFSALAAFLALSNGSRDFWSAIPRISGSVSPIDENQEFRAGDIRNSLGITISKFIYSFCGSFASLPYILRKDFYQTVFDQAVQSSPKKSPQELASTWKFDQNTTFPDSRSMTVN